MFVHDHLWNYNELSAFMTRMFLLLYLFSQLLLLNGCCDCVLYSRVITFFSEIFFEVLD